MKIKRNISNLFSSNTKFGDYHREGWGYITLAYLSTTYSPLVSIPIFGKAGYNFVQAFRHRQEINLENRLH